MFFKKKKKGVKLPDKVWMNKTEKFRGLYDHLDSALQSGVPLLIINQFENTQQEVQQMMEKLEVSHQQFDSLTDTLEDVGVLMVAAEDILLIASNTPLASQLASKAGLQIIITEHHPSYQEEQMLLAHLTQILPGYSAVAFTALDEPFMQFFGGPRIITLMERIGMKENESLEHKMISKSIARAQRRIDDDKVGSGQAESQQAWMEQHGFVKE